LSPLAGTVIDVFSRAIACGEPCGIACATVNVAGDEPKLRTLM
jgi:hypothetical protein